MCKKYTVLKFKIIPSTKKQLQKLIGFFEEANIFWNYVINNSWTNTSYAKAVKTNFLGSQIKQDMIQEFSYLLKSQKELKKINKSGKIKFKPKFSVSVYSTQPIKILFDSNRVKIQKLGKFYIRGTKSNKKYLDKLKQLEIIKDWKPVAFQLLKRATGFYIHMIVELQEYNYHKLVKFQESVGIDLGIKDNMVLSNGEVLNWELLEPRALKRLQTKLNKTHKKNIKVRKYLRYRIRKEYEKLEMQKRQVINSILNKLKKYSNIVIQDELIKLWHEGWFGKQVQHRFYGRIYHRLKQEPHVIVIDSSYPTTKLCSNCGNIKESISLNDRHYSCEACQTVLPRDLNSAINIRNIGLKLKSA